MEVSKLILQRMKELEAYEIFSIPNKPEEPHNQCQSVTFTTTAITKFCNDNKGGVSLTSSLMAQAFSFIEGTRADCYYSGCLAITEWGTLQSLSYVKL